jgi:hypothetical protein
MSPQPAATDVSWVQERMAGKSMTEQERAARNAVEEAVRLYWQPNPGGRPNFEPTLALLATIAVEAADRWRHEQPAALALIEGVPLCPANDYYDGARHCDRIRDHGGPHTWELLDALENPPWQERYEEAWRKLADAARMLAPDDVRIRVERQSG